MRSEHEDALPLIMTHGWPGSVIELLETIGPLTDPTAHGGNAEDAFHLVLPSVPGYGFSGEPTELGWYAGRIAQAWAELMQRLGYTRYVAQGGDVGAAITDAMARLAPEGLIGIHTNLLVTALGGRPAAGRHRRGKGRAEADRRLQANGFGYFLEQATRPQTIGYALLDSPVALAAWMLDHDTDSYYKISGAFVDGQADGQSHARPHPRQHHALLADGHRRLRRAVVLGERTGPGTGGRCRPDASARPRFRPASRSSRTRSSGRRAAGSSRATPTSSTSTRPTRAATSPPGRSRSSSRRGPRGVQLAAERERDEHRRGHSHR